MTVSVAAQPVSLTTTIRPLAEHELPLTVPLTKEFLEAAKLPVVFNAEKSLLTWQRLYELQRGQVWGAFSSDELVGILGVQLIEMSDADGVGLQERVWWVREAYRKGSTGIRLLKVAEAWAKDHHIPVMTLGCFTHLDGPKLARLYTAMGYTCWGATFVKEIR